MIAVIGNKQKEINKEELEEIVERFDLVELDIGTGDGRFVYKNALKRSNTLFIGMDPAEKQLEVYSRKAVRRKVENILFIIGSVENIPSEIFGSIDKVNITLPWGTLLEKIVNPTEEFMKNLRELLKRDGTMEIIFGYVPELEPSETERLNLPEINKNFIKTNVIPAFENSNFQLDNFEEISKEYLGKLETTWAKKLKFGKDRKTYRLVFLKRNN